MKNKKSKMKINIKKILLVIFLIFLIIGGYYLINNKEEIYEHFSENINIGIKKVTKIVEILLETVFYIIMPIKMKMIQTIKNATVLKENIYYKHLQEKV